MINKILMRIEELERRIGNLNIRGLVSEVDPNMGIGGCVKVKYGDEQTSNWLPVKPLRSATASVWWFPEVGEGVTVSDIENGEVIAGSYVTGFEPKTRNPDHYHVEFGDGSKVVHDRASGKLDVVNVGDVEITTNQNLIINTSGDATVNTEGSTTLNTEGSVSINSSANDIQLNGGAGVVTGAHICQFTGNPHSDCSSQVKAGK